MICGDVYFNPQAWLSYVCLKVMMVLQLVGNGGLKNSEICSKATGWETLFAKDLHQDLLQDLSSGFDITYEFFGVRSC